MTDPNKQLSYKTHCPSCNSRDNLGVYADGHAFCFSPGCGHKEPPTNSRAKPNMTPSQNRPLITNGVARELPKRKLSLATCQRWGYLCGTLDGSPVQIENFFDQHGNILVQKIRTPEKDFKVLGDSSALTLYGMHLWDSGGKSLVVTEGGIDAMTIDQVFSGNQAVVSIPNGSASAKKFFQKHLEWINSFGKVIICFDMDEAGRKAVEDVMPLLNPGKAAIVNMQLKDANEMLIADRVLELTDAIANAQTFRPDGIINGDDIDVDILFEEPAVGHMTQYPGINQKLRGIRKGELTLVTAGTGIGKSTIVRQIGHHFNTVLGLSIGNIFLEEGYKKTVQGYIAIDRKIPLGDLRQNPGLLTRAQAEDSMNACVRNGRTFFYNHFGSLDANNLLSKIDYLAAQGVDFILLDHISLVVSGMVSGREGERKDIDILMTKLRSAIEKTGIGVIAICHLVKNSNGASHEEGGRVTLDDLRGSGTLKQIPDNIIGLERNQQGDTPDECDVRVLKNREFGDVGIADRVLYNKSTGLLEAIERVDNEDPFQDTPSPAPAKGKPKQHQKVLKGFGPKKPNPFTKAKPTEIDDDNIPF